jgi:uncharacterized protein YndB with AHSA1/START domain
MTTSPAPHDVVATRVFAAPLEQVWQAWADPARVRQWWGPHGFSVPVADLDFREGGRTLLCMRAPAEYGGMDLYNTWTYTEVVPHARLRFVLRFTDAAGQPLDPAALGLPPGVPAEVPHTITFRALGPAQTEMTVTEEGYTSAQARDTSLAGLEQCLDKMAASFAPAA